MVGSRFCDLVKNLELLRVDINGDISVDLTRPQTIDNLFTDLNFDVAILFSAFTSVDESEDQRGDKNALAWKINVEGTRSIVKNCKKTNRKVIFISTDFIFDGTNGPYNEDDNQPQDLKKISWYGITKREGEKLVRGLEDHLIIRIAYPFRGPFEKKDDFAKQILKKYETGNLYPMFNDQFFTTTFIDDLAPAITLLLEKKERGTFHISSPKLTTPYGFAKILLETFGKDTKNLEEGSIINFLKNNPNSTPRPIKGGLKTEKIESLGFSPTDYINGIRKIFDQSNGKLI